MKKFRQYIIIFTAMLILLALIPIELAIAKDDFNVTSYIEKDLNNFDFNEFEKHFNALTSEQKQLFGGGSFKEKVYELAGGKYKGIDDFLITLTNLLLADVRALVPFVISLIVSIVVFGIVLNLKSKYLSQSTSNILVFVCVLSITVSIIGGVVNCVNIAKNSLASLNNQMSVLFPPLLTMVFALGGKVSVSVFQPTIYIMSVVVTKALTLVVFPLFIFSLAINLISAVSKDIKVSKLESFLKSSGVFIIGGLFTIFFASLTISGITGAVYDSISFKAAKYAISSTIPIVGGYIKDGFELIVYSGVLVKNTIGLVGLIMASVSVLSPILFISLFSLSLKCVAGITEPFADKSVTDLLSNIAKSMQTIIAAMVAVFLMYSISIIMLILSTNAFL